jgi:ubiquinone/menaquinone biosynthesis C-methylase UbiE
MKGNQYLTTMQDILKKSYNRQALTYDQQFAPLQLPKYKTLLGRDAGWIKKCSTILDLGCGTGLLLDFLHERGIEKARITGVDFSPGMCAQARMRGMHVVCVDAAELPFEEMSFQCVLSFTLLRIDPTRDAMVLSEVRRVLQPGGLLGVTILMKNDPEIFQELLEASGFMVTEVLPCGQDRGFRCVAELSRSR